MAELLIDIEQVEQIAADIDDLNKKLTDQLQNSRKLMDGLTSNNIWDGEAARATVGAFDGFAEKYFQNYQDVIDQYVKFLRVQVAQGYAQTEEQNTTMADAYK